MKIIKLNKIAANWQSSPGSGILGPSDRQYRLFKDKNKRCCVKKKNVYQLGIPIHYISDDDIISSQI